MLVDPTLGRQLMPAEITNGLVLELQKVASPTEIFCLIDTLCPGVVSEDYFAVFVL